MRARGVTVHQTLVSVVTVWCTALPTPWDPRVDPRHDVAHDTFTTDVIEQIVDVSVVEVQRLVGRRAVS